MYDKDNPETKKLKNLQRRTVKDMWGRSVRVYPNDPRHPFNTGASPKSTAGYIYVIVHPDFPGLCKIGRSRNPQHRLTQANTWCPYNKFELHHKVWDHDAMELELLVHRALQDRDRVETGEWFAINQWHAENLIYLVQRERNSRKENGYGVDGQSNRGGHRGQRVPPCRGHDLASQCS